MPQPIETPDFDAMLDPAPEYRKLAARGPVLFIKDARGLPHYGILDYKLAQEVFRDPRASKTTKSMRFALDNLGIDPASFPISAGAGAPNLLNTDPPDHTRLRGLVNKAFSPRRIRQLAEMVEARVDGLVDALKGQEEVDLVSGLTYPVGLNTICDILGVPDADRPQFRHMATQAMRPGALDQRDCAAQLNAYLRDLVADKFAATDMSISPDDQPDLLSALCAARESEDSLSAEELVSMSFLILIAGHETTVGLIGNALILLDRFPEQRAKLLADPSLMKGAIEEVLRYDGPVTRTTMRSTSEDMVVGGVTIPRGNFVLMYLSVCNRDPERWENPDQFDITRKPSGSLAFGHGAHMCVGLHLARLEAQITLEKFLAAFPDYRLTGGEAGIEWAGTVIRAASLIKARVS